MTTFQVEHKDGYALLTLDRGRSNAINQAMLDELNSFFGAAAHDEQIGGVVLAGKEHFFSAGLDVIEIYGYDEAQILRFWGGLFELLQRLAAFPKPLVAALTGHSPAGGCLLALTADYRIMADGKYRIGLNEVPVGIVVPAGIQALYAFWLGQGRAYQFLMEGRLLDVAEAREVGLVDAVVPVNEVVKMAEEKMRHYLQFSRPVWQATKRNLRAGLLQALQMPAEALAPTLEQWWRPETRAILKAMIEGLQKK